jgi:hypothetical protein
MGQLKNRKSEIEAAKILEVIVFYSDKKDMKEYLKEIPFLLVADPKRIWYEEFGVETSAKSVLNPMVWPHAVKGFILNIGRLFSLLPKKDESMFGLPADFLIDENGVIRDLKYGTHAYDQWSVDELITKANLLSVEKMTIPHAPSMSSGT